jgi:uncharacterized protein DUF1629
MKYFILKANLENDFTFVERAEYPEWLYDYYVLGGEISRPFAVKLFDDENKAKPDFLTGIQFFISVSDRFKKLLETTASGEINFYPVELINKITKETTIYYYLQIKNVISCFDWDKSKYTMVGWDEKKQDMAEWSGDTRSIPEGVIDVSLDKIKILTLNEEPIHNYSIFRMEERLHFLVINETLADKIDAASLTGVKLIPVENYSEI